MNFSLDTFELLVPFIPGILCILAIDTIYPLEDFKVHQWIIYTLLTGVIIHAIYYLLAEAVSCFRKTEYSTFLMHYATSLNIPPYEIVITSILGIILGVALGIIFDRQLIQDFLIKHHITNVLRGPVFNKVMKRGFQGDTNLENALWVRVYDKSQNIYYEGYVYEWENDKDLTAILLVDVEVFNAKTGKSKYTTPTMYIPKALSENIISFPFVDFESGEEDGN